MIQQTFESMKGIGMYGIISTLIFFVFFVLMMVHAFSLKKTEVKEFSRMPFTDEETETSKKQDQEI
jgi:cytochrome c oxidase cbb3-type subunit IV